MNINADRLWRRELEIGHIGDDPKGGVSRFAWTDEYRQAVELLSRWMRDAGLAVRMDTVGNLFGRLPGSLPEKAPILVGSHLDTVPSGGLFDGLAGVMAALEAISTLVEKGEIPSRPIEMVAFINEEASQFLGGCFGSKAMCGLLPEDYPDTCKHRYTGQSLRDAMLEFGMGLDPDRLRESVIKQGDYHAFLELHIEQGKYLLQRDLPMAAVTSIAGIKQFYITLHGVSCHAGGMAMEDRRDAMAAAVAIACEVERLALATGFSTRGTVGFIHAEPGEHNIVANKCIVPVDYREDRDEVWAKYYDDLMAFVRRECDKRGVTYEVNVTIDTPPAHCDAGLIQLIDDCAEEAGFKHGKMVSYPAHDALQLARLCPIGMIFLRSSNDGRSHCPDELTLKEDLAAGTEVLYRTLKRLTHEPASLA